MKAKKSKSKQKAKFVIVTGGVCSSIGKGVLIASIGVLLKQAGHSVSVIKCDPYLNVDPGTMSPLEHGEVFVTTDGAETDLDLGHYERMLGIELNGDSSVSSGKIFHQTLDGERKGKFLGKCIQLVPHVVDQIKKTLLDFAKKHSTDFVLVEIGGTVGDIEGNVFMEAIRQLRMDLDEHQLMHAHLSYVPVLSWTGETKTKPTQHSVNELKRAGLTPDCLFLRIDKQIKQHTTDKVSTMCGVDKQLIFQALTSDPIYEMFLSLNKQSAGEQIQKFFGLQSTKKPKLTEWKNLVEKIRKISATQSKKKIKIGIVAKYVGSNDPYISVVEAIKSAGYSHNTNVEIEVVDAEKLETSKSKQSDEWKQIKSLNGIIVPGGFDTRGSEGKILAAQWARENKIPYLGLCLGLQIMLIEFARSVLKLKNASSTEFCKKTKHPVICLLEEQISIKAKGGTMKLGASKCTLSASTKAYTAYGKQKSVMERHRHRYEFNNKYKKQFEKAGVIFSGMDLSRNLIEIAELKNHPFMIGTQFHPEFLSSPIKPHPLFSMFTSSTHL